MFLQCLAHACGVLIIWESCTTPFWSIKAPQDIKDFIDFHWATGGSRKLGDWPDQKITDPQVESWLVAEECAVEVVVLAGVATCSIDLTPTCGVYSCFWPVITSKSNLRSDIWFIATYTVVFGHFWLSSATGNHYISDSTGSQKLVSGEETVQDIPIRVQVLPLVQRILLPLAEFTNKAQEFIAFEEKPLLLVIPGFCSKCVQTGAHYISRLVRSYRLPIEEKTASEDLIRVQLLVPDKFEPEVIPEFAQVDHYFDAFLEVLILTIFGLYSRGCGQTGAHYILKLLWSYQLQIWEKTVLDIAIGVLKLPLTCRIFQSLVEATKVEQETTTCGKSRIFPLYTRVCVATGVHYNSELLWSQRLQLCDNQVQETSIGVQTLSLRRRIFLTGAEVAKEEQNLVIFKEKSRIYRFFPWKSSECESTGIHYIWDLVLRYLVQLWSLTAFEVLIRAIWLDFEDSVPRSWSGLEEWATFAAGIPISLTWTNRKKRSRFWPWTNSCLLYGKEGAQRKIWRLPLSCTTFQGVFLQLLVLKTMKRCLQRLLLLEYCWTQVQLPVDLEIAIWFWGITYPPPELC